MAIDSTGSSNTPTAPTAPEPDLKTGKSGSSTTVQKSKKRLPEKPANSIMPAKALQNRRITGTESKTGYGNVNKQCLYLAQTNRYAGALIAVEIKDISDRPFLESLLKVVKCNDTYGEAADAIQDAINKLNPENSDQKETTMPLLSVKRRNAKSGSSPNNRSDRSAESSRRHAIYFDEHIPMLIPESDSA